MDWINKTMPWLEDHTSDGTLPGVKVGVYYKQKVNCYLKRWMIILHLHVICACRLSDFSRSDSFGNYWIFKDYIFRTLRLKGFFSKVIKILYWIPSHCSLIFYNHFNFDVLTNLLIMFGCNLVALTLALHLSTLSLFCRINWKTIVNIVVMRSRHVLNRKQTLKRSSTRCKRNCAWIIDLPTFQAKGKW